MSEPNKLKVFLWAAMHSEEFNLCYIQLPAWIRFFRLRRMLFGEWISVWSIEFHQMHAPFGVYVPWSVEDAYRAAHGQKLMYDEIPF